VKIPRALLARCGKWRCAIALSRMRVSSMVVNWFHGLPSSAIPVHQGTTWWKCTAPGCAAKTWQTAPPPAIPISAPHSGGT